METQITNKTLNEVFWKVAEENKYDTFIKVPEEQKGTVEWKGISYK
jgi:hypothetical protein